MTGEDDNRLIDDCLGGNRAAFGELVRKHQDRLFNAICRVLGSEDDARDVVQEAFVQAYLKLDTFRGAAAFSTWIYRIAFNTAISSRRRRRAVSLEPSRDGEGKSAAIEPADGGPAPSDRMEQQERVAQVQAALSALAEDHRVILVLRDIEDRSYEEIAEILELPIGTVRSRLHRARMELRNQLKLVLQEELQ